MPDRTTQPNPTLARYESAADQVVADGCPPPPPDYMDLHNVPELAIASREKWVREVVWRYYDTEWMIPDGSYLPRFCDAAISDLTGDPWRVYRWKLGKQEGDPHDPTEAYIQTLEAIARVVGEEG